MATTESLMSIAKNSDLRVYERIRIIKGEDKIINSVSEANAIIAIPASDIIPVVDNPNELSLAKMDAFNYLKENEASKNKEKRTELKNNPLKTVSDLYKEYEKVKTAVNNIYKYVNTNPLRFLY